MKESSQLIVPLALFALILILIFDHKYGEAVLVFFFMFALIFRLVFKESEEETERGRTYQTNSTQKPYHTYYGEELDFPEDTISGCLAKHLPYYSGLNAAEKEKFLQRLQQFIHGKTFRIHDRQGFKEMPILVSAAAIQLSFGFENYLLPQFEFIHIFPQEFVHSHSAFNLLEGNVSGQSINISWKHFLEGFEYPTDGQNVGLHEMAHAYYCQNFLCEDNIDGSFVSGFHGFNTYANKAFEQEKIPGNDLYSDYALKNFQEFWAESIEIFFEKPVYLNNTYPDLYAALSALLRQDPLHNIASMVG